MRPRASGGRDSALRIGLWVGLASILTLASGTGILVFLILSRSRTEGVLGGSDDVGPGLPAGDGDGDRVVIDVDQLIPAVIALSLIGAVLLAVIAWVAARSALRPLTEALRLQERFVADASHELRTPLTALSSRIQILQRRRAAGQPLDDTISALRHDAAVLDEVLTDMLLFAEEGGARAGDADLAAAVTAACRVIEPLAAEHGIALASEIEGAPRARLPEQTLTRLCVALLDNATQYAPQGSIIRVSARAAGGRAEIRISDSGPGVPPDAQQRIFERFGRGGETGRRRGFGLGLALAREGARRHGGDVEIEQTGPAGTTFLITLPLAG